MFDILIKRTLKKKKDHNFDFEPLGDNSGKHPVFLGFTKIGSLFVPYLSEKSKSEIIEFSFNINSTLNYCLLSFLIICCPHFKATSEGEKEATYLSRCSSACDEKRPFLNL